MSDKNERMIELKACPFCGGEAKYGNKGRNWIVCKNCGIETPFFVEPEDAIVCWNTRKQTGEAVMKKTEIEQLDLSVRTQNCLKRAGVFTVEDLCKKTKLDVMRIRNLGRKSVQELLDVMKENGLEFREE